MKLKYIAVALTVAAAVLVVLGGPAYASESTKTKRPMPEDSPATQPAKPPARFLPRIRPIEGLKGPEQPQTPPLAITSPVKYEGWATDAKHLIRWTSTLPADARVKIELIRAGSAAINVWKTVVAATSNSGSYEWQGVEAAQYSGVPSALQVRISTLDGSVAAVSDIFLFGRPLYLHEPAAPYTWRKGSQASIVWETISQLPNPLDLELLDSNREPVLRIAAGVSTVPRASTNKREVYKWLIPSDLASGYYFIRVSSGPLSKENPIHIEDAIVFPVSPQITITEPQSCDGWATDTKHTIRWNSTLPAESRVKIEFVQTGPAGITLWRTVSADAPNSGSYEWEGISSAQLNALSYCAYVRISTLDGTQVTVGDPFVIGRPLTLVEPKTPYIWRKGSQGTIMWELVCQMHDPLNVDLLDSNRQPVLNIANGLSVVPRVSTNKRQVYLWTIPASLTPGLYFIRLTSGSISQEKPINIGAPLG